MEHVQNIESFKNEIERILKPGGYVFWEVPNGNCPSNGAQHNRVDIPHTYYFETNFFKNWFAEVLICGAYKWNHHSQYIIQSWNKFEDESGNVIRALGRLN